MARDQVWDGVVPERSPHSPHSTRPADLARHPGVRADLASRDLGSLAQYVLLERTKPGQVEAQASIQARDRTRHLAGKPVGRDLDPGDWPAQPADEPALELTGCASRP